MLIAANAHLQEKQAAQKAVVDKLATLEKALAAAEAEQARLKQQANVTAVRLQRAAKLTNGLQEEGVRWGKSAHQIKVRGKLDGITTMHGLGSSVLHAELNCRETKEIQIRACQDANFMSSFLQLPLTWPSQK